MEPDGDLPTLHPKATNMQPDPGANFTIDDVVKKLHDLKPDKFPGIDSVHPYVLRECVDEIAVPLYYIY